MGTAADEVLDLGVIFHFNAFLKFKFLNLYTQLASHVGAYVGCPFFASNKKMRNDENRSE
jgi:hypothetical protein